MREGLRRTLRVIFQAGGSNKCRIPALPEPSVPKAPRDASSGGYVLSSEDVDHVQPIVQKCWACAATTIPSGDGSASVKMKIMCSYDHPPWEWERGLEDGVRASFCIFLMFARLIAASKVAGSKRLVNTSPLCSAEAWYCRVQSPLSTRIS